MKQMETQEQMSMKMQSLSELIAATIKLHNHCLQLEPSSWKFLILSQPKVMMASEHKIDSINLLYKIEADTELCKTVVRNICLILSIPLDKSSFETASGPFLICHYPKANLGAREPQELASLNHIDTIPNHIKPDIFKL